jgi:hypothetical protein
MLKSALYKKRSNTPMPQPQNQPLKISDKIRTLFVAKNTKPDPEYSPYFYVEARIDFNDVRTGFRETVSTRKALELFSDAELLWSDDMICEVDPESLRLDPPSGARLQPLPEFVDERLISSMETQFIQYLLRSFEARVYRNPALNIYSFSGETSNQFTGRCLELFDAPMRRDLESLHEVFNRKLEQIKQKYLHAEDESGELIQAKVDSENRDVFSRVSERVAGLFLSAEISLRPESGPFRNLHGVQELEERLLSLELEAQQAITKLWDSYMEKARAMDEYMLHPNLKDIHLVRSCILWMPV